MADPLTDTELAEKLTDAFEAVYGPVFGSPEYLADPVKLARAEKRRRDGAIAYAKAALPIIKAHEAETIERAVKSDSTGDTPTDGVAKLTALLREALPHVEAIEMEGDLDIRDLLLRIDAALSPVCGDGG